ncbi:tetratricopeptide repeat protein [Streptomyces sp. NPDC054784]
MRSSPSRTVGSVRARMGVGLVTVPDVPRADPGTVVLPNPEVPERKRFCSISDCGAPVGRTRGDRAGRTEGFCTKCGNPYSFVPKLRKGDMVHGQYEIVGCLAHGGLGWIYLAVDRAVSDRWVVLKGLLDTGDQDAMAAAISERRFLAEIEHNNIVRIYNFVEHLDRRTGSRDGYIVMEYVGGKSLKELANARRTSEGRRDPLPVEQACAYGIEALEALGHLHSRNLLYCDFKVDNAIQQDNQLKLIDLGAVRRMDDDDSPIYGTVGYQAPEVAEHGPSVASDLYSVARTLAVLTFDFQGYTNVFVDSLPEPSNVEAFQRFESFYRFLVRATDPDPHRRFASAAEMSEQLTGVLREVVALQTGRPRPSVSTLLGPELRVVDTELLAATRGDTSTLGGRKASSPLYWLRRGGRAWASAVVNGTTVGEGDGTKGQDGAESGDATAETGGANGSGGTGRGAAPGTPAASAVPPGAAGQGAVPAALAGAHPDGGPAPGAPAPTPLSPQGAGAPVPLAAPEGLGAPAQQGRAAGRHGAYVGTPAHVRLPGRPPPPPGGPVGGRGSTGPRLVPLEASTAALSLPVPRVDTSDPNAGFLAGMMTSAPAEVLAALRDAPVQSVERRLRELRARLELATQEGRRAAERALVDLEAEHSDDWRVVWYRGVVGLVSGDWESAAVAFDAIYDAFPGEPAPKLALGICAEVLGQLDNAAEYYRLVWSTDPSYVSAAFGLARVRLSVGQRQGAVQTLESVPEASIHFTAARVAAIRARLRERSPEEHLLVDLHASALQIVRLRDIGLDERRGEELTTEVLGRALDWVLAGRNGAPGGPHRQGPTSGLLLGCRLEEEALRAGLERSYRKLARLALTGAERIELVEQANRFRPRTWV